ncbi:MAG: hypothetical protein DHS20C21_12690 [Gemmatimonadota bacterium]|nr:MAG: hypothetical protein DHS20C21_12690 [Gemmatimonadota bacterium]
MKQKLLLALLLVVAIPMTAIGIPDAKWGEVARDELFATHFPEVPQADAVVLFDYAIARVDSKDRLKYTRHHRTKIFKDAALDRGVVRIPYSADEEIKNFRGHTIVPPGHLVEVKGDHQRVEEHGDSRVLVVEFPDVKPGVVIEYQYELRRDDLHILPVWSFRGPDFTRFSRYELLIPAGLTYDASFSWVPGLTPRAKIQSVNDPEDPARTVQQVAWELTDQPAVVPVPMAGDPEQYRTQLYVQLGEFRSSFKNYVARRSWEEVGALVAKEHAAFLKNANGVKDWAAAAGATGDARAKAQALFRHVRSQLHCDDNARTLVEPATLSGLVQAGHGSPAAKNLLLAHLLRENGVPADVVLVRRASNGPMQPKYHDPGQFDHAIVRVDLGGEMIWADASHAGCPLGLLPPDLHVAQGLLVREQGSDLVGVTMAALPSGREIRTEATFDANGSLHAKSTVRFDGWEALAARGEAVADGGRSLAEALLSDRFGGAANLDSFEVDALESDADPLTLTVAYTVADYAHEAGGKVTLRIPYLSAWTRNPLPASEGERELPVRLGFVGETTESVQLTIPEGWSAPAPPARGSARTADLRYKVSHKAEDSVLSSSRSVDVREPTVRHDGAAELRSVFDQVVATDASELVLQRQSVKTSSTR